MIDLPEPFGWKNRQRLFSQRKALIFDISMLCGSGAKSIFRPEVKLKQSVAAGISLKRVTTTEAA